MTPAQLTAESFRQYSPKGRQMAVQALPLLKDLPLGFAPFLLKEIAGAEAKFPVELHELEAQISYLEAMPPEARALEMRPFANLTLNSKLEGFDWVNSPGQFLEILSAHLWASHQMDGFRAASETYVRKFHATLTPVPLPGPRAGIVVIGAGVSNANGYRRFVKLGREGTIFTGVEAQDGLAVLQHALEVRAQRLPGAYVHWYLDGSEAPRLKGFSIVDYSGLAPLRDALAKKMLEAYEAQHFDPELLRTNLAKTTFQSLGLRPSGDQPLDEFSLTLLTEGSGTQIYSTTFVQWAAREALRRAQPVTLFARFTPRQRAKNMDELLAGAKSNQATDTDAMGSLIDADMGAYYTWLNQQRLPEAAASRFLVWFENHSEAVIVSPGHPRGKVDNSTIQLAELANRVLA